MSVPDPDERTQENASSAKLDDQDHYLLLQLVEQEIADTRSWPQRAVALSTLRQKLNDLITSQETLGLAYDEA